MHKLKRQLSDRHGYAQETCPFDDDQASTAGTEERLPDGEPTEEFTYQPLRWGPGQERPEEPPAACIESVYGQPVSPEEAAAQCPPGTGGLVYHAHLLPDDYTPPEDLADASTGELKPRRASLPVRAKDFLASLVMTADGRVIFSGVLNGWPGLTCLELRSITCKLVGRLSAQIVRPWDAAKDGGSMPDLATIFVADDSNRNVRATLRMASWSSHGWSPSSPGAVWWFHSQRAAKKVAYGEDIIRGLRQGYDDAGDKPPACTRATLFAHRYALGKRPESTKDKVTYHGAILLEWDHGAFCTVVELATLNGCGGRKGKANWHRDKLQEVTELYSYMPPELIAPWHTDLAEIRCHDVPMRTPEEFKEFLDEFTGPDLRFIDPHFASRGSRHCGDVRLTFRRQDHIARYLLNYMGRDGRYRQEFRNCQTFAADFFSFLAGHKDIKPFHPVCRVAYRNRSHLFLYEPDAFRDEEDPASASDGT